MAGIPPIEPYSLPSAEVLPPNTAHWTVDPGRVALLVHDMQHYFLQPFPRAVRDPLVRNAARLRRQAVASGVPVAYTAQPGGMSDEQRGLLKDFWGPGMRVDPADRAVVEPLAPAPRDAVFTKWRYSAFHRSGLLRWLREHGRDQLVICGVYAHVGVLMSVVEAFTHDIQPFLVADAVADFSADDHRLAIEYAARRCAVVTTTDSIATALESSTPPVPSDAQELNI
ncbi:isochorismatase family protein [Streptomyces sp. JJ66]|uniref:isochorismatase family protein n=1 Tax=Streptomyces sp. JJ66 TaxID=2803843 RepID=UPI001C586624|nr:isochorismatase family protein [Streptomyces sp. JJ66]MBW1601482.1 isochorismatase family protein [Streptomyces sp. JJ66]